MCNCNNCFNNLEHEEDRQRAIRSCLERNPNAFRPKIGKGVVGDERRHNKGCNCKRSGCLKNYCECYEVLEFILRRWNWRQAYSISIYCSHSWFH
jgi:hypothetical protein